MPGDRPDAAPIEPPLSGLARALVDEFLRARGYDAAALDALPADVRERVLTEASVYASAKLTEVESRAHFVHDVHEAARND